MLLGALFPFTLLLLYEMWARASLPAHPDYFRYRDQVKTVEKTQRSELPPDDPGNRYGIRVLGVTLGITSLIIIILGIIADKGTILVTSIGAVILLVGILLFKRSAVKVRRGRIELSHIKSDESS